jgi:hypothetical protein
MPPEAPIPDERPRRKPRAPKPTLPSPDAVRTKEFPLVGSLSALTKAEASSYQQMMVDGFLEFWKVADDVITHTNKAKQTAIIWQTIDAIATEKLVVVLLGAGQKHPLVAESIRHMAEAFKALQVGAILGPRFVATWRFYMENGIGLWL